ncbi:MAG: carbohydrate-binding domain-containing protein [Treponema sp.]|nr:carbohydrate-binding domain-containing protein [Treponema sp.]
MKGLYKNFIIILFISFLSISCKTGFTPSTSYTSASGAAYFSSEADLYINVSDCTYSEDNSTFTTISTSEAETSQGALIALESSNGTATGQLNINLENVSENLIISISGTNDTDIIGGIRIQTNESTEVGVCLSDITFTSTDFPCLEITKGAPASVKLEGSNTFKDGRKFGYGYGDSASTCASSRIANANGSDSKGSLYCKGSMTICGDGSLSVTQAYKNCIASKAVLTIDGGSLTLTSDGKNGLYADSSVVINDGTISFTGSAQISSSSFRKCNGIATETDDSTSSVYINGGQLDISTYNGKGINSSLVYINGGTNTFDVTGVTGYTDDDNKTASYYDADGTYNENVSVAFSAEGIEGAYLVQITGGKTSVTATDDGINVSDSSASFYLKDGYIYIYSTNGDGIDCNGNLYLQGGAAVSYAPTGSEDAFDCGDSNNKVYLSGGTIAGTSGSSNCVNNISISGSQRLLYFSSSSGMGGSNKPGSSSSSTSFSSVAVQVSSSTVYAYSLPSSSFGCFVMSCPSFTSSSSSSYSVYTAPTIPSSDFNGLCLEEESLANVTLGSSKSTPSVK